MIWLLILVLLVLGFASGGPGGCLSVLGMIFLAAVMWGLWVLVDTGYDCTPRPNYSEECN